MKVIIAGGSGFLGRALQRRLEKDGHAVAILTRRPRAASQQDLQWTPDGRAGDWARAIDGADVVINLAGEGVADRRWSVARKQALRDSRILATRSLVAAIRAAENRPPTFVSASAVGYYGPHGDEIVTEGTAPGEGFLSQLSVEWEDEAQAATELTRLALVRTGLVLHPAAGALAKMLLPFKLGAGGTFASGAQYMPWIHLDDWVDLVVWLSGDARARGPFNATAPNPTTNAEFTKTLARVLNRPAFIPIPGFGLRLAVGGSADSLVTGQRAIPGRALDMGFTFRFPQLEPALRDLLAK